MRREFEQAPDPAPVDPAEAFARLEQAHIEACAAFDAAETPAEKQRALRAIGCAQQALDQFVRDEERSLVGGPVSGAPPALEPNTAYVLPLPAGTSRRVRASQAQLVSALRDAGCQIVLMGKGGRLS